MNTKNMTVEEAQKDIEMLKKRIAFNNSLNAVARKFRKEHAPSKFNGYWNEPMQEMKDIMYEILTKGTLGDVSWMSADMKKDYSSSTYQIFAGFWSPAVNTYVLNDLHDCEKFVQMHNIALSEPEEKNDLFSVKRDTSENRLNLFFDGKPEDEVRSELKHNGFKWSPSRGCWTRQLTPEAESSLRRLTQKLKDAKLL